MTIHEMMQQVALLTSGKYSREDNVSLIDIPTVGNRGQVIYGKLFDQDEGDTGLLYTPVGPLIETIDPIYLLRINASLQWARTALLSDDTIILIATFDLPTTSIKECARIMQEVAAVADDLEFRFFSVDEM
ncbi:MAG: hypothetical protein KFH87_13725 [Bacteroidetes bacterium]|nr:hypothetical protein [Bacteroidota bacterium]